MDHLDDKLKLGVNQKLRKEKLRIRKIGHQAEGDDSFQQRFLDPENPKCTADEFFKEISYLIDLNQLYKVKDTCYYNDEMPYIPILLELNVDKMRDVQFDGCRYLIQVWNQEKKKIWEKSIRNPIRYWAVCFNYLIIAYDQKEAQSDVLHIINLNDLEQKIQVKNFGLENDVKWVAYKSNKLYTVSHTEIKFATLNMDVFSQGLTEPIEIKREHIRVIKPGCLLHGILINDWMWSGEDCIVVIFESPDNQLDFNMLYAYNVDDASQFDYKWEQYRIVNPKSHQLRPDPIKKVISIFSGGFNYSITLKSSGLIDIYWNMARKDSPKTVFFQDIGLTIEAFYFKLVDGTTQYFKHCGLSNITFAQSILITEEEADWDNFIYKKINKYIRLYTPFVIDSEFETYVMIGYGKWVSVFNIEQWRWIRHIYFKNDEVYGIHRRTLDSYYGEQYDVVLQNGQIFQNINHLSEEIQETPTCQTGMPVARINEDIQKQTGYAVMCYHNYSCQIFLVGASQCFPVQFDELNVNTSLVFVQHPGDEPYCIITKYNSVVLYKITYNSYEGTLAKVREFKMDDSNYIDGQAHSCVSYDVKDHLFVFTQQKLIVLFADKRKIALNFDNIFCVGAKFFTKEVTYCLCQNKPGSKHKGLRLLDMNSTIKRKEPNLMLLKVFDFGCSATFEYSIKTQRIGFLSSLTQCVVTPLLHQNSNKLLGANESDVYICSKINRDRLITYTQEGSLTTWNLVTGKHICTYDRKDQLDLSSWQLLNKYKETSIFFQSIEDQTGFKDEDFFEQWQLFAYAEKQQTYIKRCERQFKRFRIVEIKNESEVNVTMEFTFPYFTQMHQFYLSENKNRMILKIINFRTFVYDIVPSATTGNKEVTLRLIRQIVDYPEQFDNDVEGTITFFSPCFSRYFKTDMRTGEFVIKEVVNDTIVVIVPKDILSFYKGSEITPKQIMHRLKWIDYSTILVINNEGIEKIINIDNNFQEVTYNQRPLFENEDIEMMKDSPYFFKKKPLEQTDVLGRLKRMYQNYKMDYYLFKKKSFTQFYEKMLTVDEQSMYFNEHSFTFLHWSLIEQLMKKKVKVRMLEEQVLQEILYNILPGGNTIVHLLCNKEKQLMLLFKTAHQDEQIKIHVPFLPNIIGESPIHKCIENQDFKSVDTILKYLKYYPSDHHSRAIKDKYGEFVKQQLPGFLEYLDSRFLMTDQIKRYNKGCLKKNQVGVITSELWFKEQDFFKEIIDKDQLETRMRCEFIDLPGVYHYLDQDFPSLIDNLAITTQESFFEKKAVQRMIDFNYPLVRTFIIAFLFVPFCLYHVLFVAWANGVYEYRGMSEEYERANLGCAIVLLVFSTYFLSNEMRQLFREGMEYIVSIWNYIDLVQPIGVIFTMILVILQHAGHEIDQLMFRCVFAFTTFFMWIKLLYFLRIFKSTGYLIRMIVEVLNDMGIFLLVLMITLTAFGDSFLRISLANEPDNQFIQYSPMPTIDEEGNLIGSGDENVTSLEGTARRLFFFAVAYAYRGILGDFDTSTFGTVATPLVWIIWTLNMLFNMIVMLNLLISIIGDTYSRVVNSQEQAAYQEMACLIAENQHLIPSQFKKSYAAKGQYLVSITNLEQINDNDLADPVTSRLDEMKDQLTQMQEHQEKIFEHLDVVFKKINRQYPASLEEDQEEDHDD